MRSRDLLTSAVPEALTASSRAVFTIEERLAAVVEEEGRTIVSPQGVRVARRRVQSVRNIQTAQAPTLVIEDERTRASGADLIAELDARLVRSVVRATDGGKVKVIVIRHRSHVRSAYVVSLRSVGVRALAEQRDGRISFEEALRVPLPVAPLLDPTVYVAFAQDLNIERGLAHELAEQFTHEDFFESYRKTYGPLDWLLARWRMTRRPQKGADEGEAEEVVVPENISTPEIFVMSEALKALRQPAPSEVSEEVEVPLESTESDSVLIQEIALPPEEPAQVDEECQEPLVLTAYEPEKYVPEPVIGASWRHTFVGFIALASIVLVPAAAIAMYRSATETRAAVEDRGMMALADVRAATKGRDIGASATSLKQASERFRAADAALSDSHTLAFALASVVPKKYQSARALLEAGDKASEAGRLLAQALDRAFRDSDRRLDERLEVASAYARGVLPLIEDAASAAATVSLDDIPAEQRATVAALTADLRAGAAAVRELADVSDFMSILVGKDRTRTYLFVFQNQTELRPSGGFMGSVAEVQIDRGRITKVRVPPGGTYDLKGQMLAHVISPEPLHLINPHWQFQDANWFADFPTSARKIMWFWSKAGQPTLDGVIAVNATFMQHLLDITGPLEMSAYGKTIDSSNFLLETQKAVEIEYDKTANTPKKFIGDMMAVLMERVKTMPQEKWVAVASAASEALATKEIQIAFRDEDEERRAETYGWSGLLKETNGDSLALIEANVAGQKTDGVIEENVEHQADVQADGSIIDRVKVIRTHHGQKGDLFRGVRNVSYLRLYVPEGSELLEARGFETPPAKFFKQPDEDYVPDADLTSLITRVRPLGDGVTASVEGGRSVFGGWVQLDPGATQTITYRYRLPFTVYDLRQRLELVAASTVGQSASATDHRRGAYSLLLTSQSGKSDRSLTSTVTFPASAEIVWSRGESTTSGKALTYRGTWDRDRVIAALISAPTP